MKKNIIAFLLSFNLMSSSAKATILLTDYPHLSKLKTRAEAILPLSASYQYQFDETTLIRRYIYAVCLSGTFSNAQFRAVYDNAGQIPYYRRQLVVEYSLKTDEFLPFDDTWRSEDGISRIPDEFSLRFGRHCLGFNVLVDYFDSSSFQGGFNSILSFSRFKSGCYALAVPFYLQGYSSSTIGLKQNVFNTSSAFVSGRQFSIPDTSGLTKLITSEADTNYDKAYFAAQWVNPQCKWLPKSFRHKASFWGSLSNFFSSLFF
jgi:hypothetical protein